MTQTATQAPYEGNAVVSLSEKVHTNARNLNGDKELVRSLKYLATNDAGEIVDVVEVRWWMGRSRNASMVHCSIWVRVGHEHRSGYGTAGGWGYCKESASLDGAITSAGIKLEAHINGCGDAAILHAVRAIGARAGFPDGSFH